MQRCCNRQRLSSNDLRPLELRQLQDPTAYAMEESEAIKAGRKERRKKWWAKCLKNDNESGGVDGSVNRERGKPVVERGKRSVGKRSVGKRSVGKRRVGKQASFSSSTSTAGFRRSSQQMLGVRKSPSSAPHSNPHHSLTATGTHTASDNSEESDSSVDEDSSQTPSAGVAQVAAVDAGPKHIPPTTPTQSSSARAEATVADEDAIKLAPQCLTAPVSTGKKHRYIAFIGNLPFSVTTGDIIAHFRKRGVVASEVRLLTKKNSEESRGCCFAEFQDAKTLQNALKFHHTLLQGRRVNVEVTCGGGGKGEARTRKIRDRNERLRRAKQRVKTSFQAI